VTGQYITDIHYENISIEEPILDSTNTWDNTIICKMHGVKLSFGHLRKSLFVRLPSGDILTIFISAISDIIILIQQF